MNSFPDIKINSIDNKIIKPVYTSSYDGGYEQQRLKNTRTIRKFTLGFTSLTNSEAQTLETFFEQNQALEFSFTHPITNNIHTVRFDGNSISFTQNTPLYQSVSFDIKEV